MLEEVGEAEELRDRHRAIVALQPALALQYSSGFPKAHENGRSSGFWYMFGRLGGAPAVLCFCRWRGRRGCEGGGGR